MTAIDIVEDIVDILGTLAIHGGKKIVHRSKWSTMDLSQSSILRVPTCVWWDEFWRGAVEDERRSRMFWKACMSGIEEVPRFAGEADSSTGF